MRVQILDGVPGLCLASRPRGGACTSAFVEGLLATARPGRDGAAVLRASSARGPMGQARQRHKPSALPVGSGLRTNRSIAERKSRPATRRDRVRQEPGLNDRQARAKHLAALPARAASRGPRGSRRAREQPSLPSARRLRHRSRRQPLVESKAHSLLHPGAAPPRRRRSSSQLKARSARPHSEAPLRGATLPRGLP